MMNKEAQLATMLVTSLAMALFGWALVYRILAGSPKRGAAPHPDTVTTMAERRIRSVVENPRMNQPWSSGTNAQNELRLGR
jgi:hypothetical protein